MDQVNFGYDAASTLLAGVSFELTAGWTGVVGENGAGKSTLLGLAGGQLEPSSGCVRVSAGATRCLCPQVVDTLEPSVEDFAEAWDGESRRLRARLLLAPEDLERWPSLSPGERKRWQIAAALARQPDILMLDEPTNHLDIEARDTLLEALRSYGGIGLVVAHDRAFLDELTTATLRLDAGRAEVFPGSVSRAQELWQQDQAAQARVRRDVKQRQANAARKLQDKQRQANEAQAARSARTRMKSPKDSDGRSVNGKARAAKAEAQASRRAGALRSQLEQVQSQLASLPAKKAKGGAVRLQGGLARSRVLIHLDLPQLQAGSSVLARDVRCSVGRQSRIHLMGANGSGKSTLLGKLANAYAGQAESMLYLQQELSLQQRRELSARLQSEAAAARGQWLTLAACLGLDPARVLRSPCPSPGEARKLALSRALATRAHLLILDEPLNHFDLPAIERLEQALSEYAGAVVLVSHDRRFAEAITNETWKLGSGRLKLP